MGEELGIEPSPELARLEQAILLHEPELDWRPPQDPPLPVALQESVDLPTGVVTFLLTDVVDSTRMWDEQPHVMAEALAMHDEIIRSEVTATQGRVLNPHCFSCGISSVPSGPGPYSLLAPTATPKPAPTARLARSSPTCVPPPGSNR